MRYFVKHGERVNCAALDASKAFNKILSYGLFYKMLSKGISSYTGTVSRLKSAVLWNSGIGECFPISCGVRQGGVLSPHLFAYYTDDLIDDVKRSGYGIYKGSLFLGCILYADNIILLSGSCYGLQQMVDICANYGRQWNIKFNATKSQCITSVGNRACSSRIILNNAELTRSLS